MTIYIRTAAGNEAALNPRSSLPRKLRTLLIGIDGRTRVGTYINCLSSFGDVDALLSSLHEAGLIEPIGPMRQLAAHDVEDVPVAAARGAPWSDTEAGSTGFKETVEAPSGAFDVLSDAFRQMGIPASAQGSDELSSWARFEPPAAPVSVPTNAVGRQPAQMGYYAPSNHGRSSSTAQYQLRNAISLMSDFVTQHLPAESLEIVLALEGLGSVEQVLASLKGYEALVMPAGEPARRHLVELRSVLSRF